MAKFWETFHNLDFPWASVASIYWRRYPNPNSDHVFSEDFVECRPLDDGRLYTKRFIMKTNKVPRWAHHFFNAKRVSMMEEAIIDPKAKTMVTYTRNIQFRYFMGTTERVVYSDAGIEGTKVCKQVWIESDVLGFRSAIKSFGVERFKKNCVKATEGFHHVLLRFSPSAVPRLHSVKKIHEGTASSGPATPRAVM